MTIKLAPPSQLAGSLPRSGKSVVNWQEAFPHSGKVLVNWQEASPVQERFSSIDTELPPLGRRLPSIGRGFFRLIMGLLQLGRLLLCIFERTLGRKLNTYSFMKVHLVLLLVCFFLLNCSKKEEVKNEVYIISKEQRKLDTMKNILPWRGFYGLRNVIIDEKGDLYFYQKEYLLLICGTKEENLIPEFIDLSPNDLIKIPKNTAVDFIRENIAMQIKKKKAPLVIASQLDTLKNNTFLNYVKDYKKSQIATYMIRRTTQEEDVVLRFKKNNSPYNPKSVKWDKSRIKFFDSK